MFPATHLTTQDGGYQAYEKMVRVLLTLRLMLWAHYHLLWLQCTSQPLCLKHMALTTIRNTADRCISPQNNFHVVWKTSHTHFAIKLRCAHLRQLWHMRR